MKITDTRYMEVPCMRCFARVGAPCEADHGSAVPIHYFHNERRQAWHDANPKSNERPTTAPAAPRDVSFVERALVLSTAHMPGPDPEFGDVGKADHEHGHVVFVVRGTTEYDDRAAPWLRPVLAMARTYNASLINFDCDACEVPGLETWSW